MAQSTALARAERLSASLKRVKDQAKATTRRGIAAGATLGGAAVAGFVDAKFPSVGASTLAPSTMLGLAGLGIGLLGLVDEYSDHLVAAGAGVLAPAVRDESKQYFSS